MLVCYVFGIPAIQFWLLYKNAYVEVDKTGRKFWGLAKQSIVLKYSFLYNGYERMYYYWELVVVSRKVLITIVAVFLVNNVQVQALMAVALVVVGLMAHIYARPFYHPLMDILEYLSLLVSFVTYFGGQFFFVTKMSFGWLAFLSFLIVAINVMFIALCLFVMYMSTFHEQQLQRQLQSFGIHQPEDAVDAMSQLSEKAVELQGVPEHLQEMQEKEAAAPASSASSAPASQAILPSEIPATPEAAAAAAEIGGPNDPLSPSVRRAVSSEGEVYVI